MKAKMRFSLKPGERIFINGAVICVSQKVTLSLLNDASFLLESYVMQFDDANTPLRQLYFITQTMIIDPSSRSQMKAAFLERFALIAGEYAAAEEARSLQAVYDLVTGERFFDALKLLRTMFPIDDAKRPVDRSGTALRAA